MAHSHAHLRSRHHQKARQALHRAGYAAGGRADEAEDKKMIKAAVHKHEEHDHPGKPLTKLKKGGRAEGKKARHRLDREPRAAGGRNKHGKGKTQVNVIVGHQQPPPPAPMMAPHPMPMARPPMPPPGAGGPPPGGPPPGLGAPPSGVGGPPRPPMAMANRGGRMERKHGGRAAKAEGGEADDESPNPVAKHAMQPEIFARGAKAKPNDAGSSGSGGAQSTEEFRKAVNQFPENNPSAASDDGGTEKRGGTVRKRKAKATGGETTAGPLDYDGAMTQGNSVPSPQKNSGSSNEDEASGEHRGGRTNRTKRAAGGAAAWHTKAGGMGRIQKAEKYGADAD
jgi:hypothetical protein